MKAVYSNENSLLVANAKNLLEHAGIEVALQNDYAGGGLGELAPIDVWVQVWVRHDADYARALQLLSTIAKSPTADWRCQQCEEINGDAFEFCWQCQQPRLSKPSQ